MKRIGFGQVEPNHLSAQRTAQIYAQLPAHKKAGDEDTVASIEVLENGQFVKYDYANGEVNFTGEGEWMLVFNEVKLYDGWRETYKDYAMQAKNFTNGVMTPRVFKTNIGDIFTTNTLGDGSANVAVEVGDILCPNENGYLVVNADGEMAWQVVKVYTLADGQEAVKIMRIK